MLITMNICFKLLNVDIVSYIYLVHPEIICSYTVDMSKIKHANDTVDVYYIWPVQSEYTAAQGFTRTHMSVPVSL